MYRINEINIRKLTLLYTEKLVKILKYKGKSRFFLYHEKKWLKPLFYIAYKRFNITPEISSSKCLSYVSLLPSKAFDNVTSSVYSKSPPTGIP